MVKQIAVPEKNKKLITPKLNEGKNSHILVLSNLGSFNVKYDIITRMNKLYQNYES